MTRQEQIHQETEIAQDIHKELASVKEERITAMEQDEFIAEIKKDLADLKLAIDESDLKARAANLRKQSEDAMKSLGIISKDEFVAAINESKTKEEAMKKLGTDEETFEIRRELFGLTA